MTFLKTNDREREILQKNTPSSTAKVLYQIQPFLERHRTKTGSDKDRSENGSQLAATNHNKFWATRSGFFLSPN